ncbi:GDP-fucose transporter [Parelaphostrongylus tenuis]|uniref:GDP-fucose transporter n=1 Tax=Parelaphostrongylus tenuis TaxID=148309 RepID=A0AAD5R2Z9_PARTN|nr:GDP-fucose transporter [Parelaphostrongylus tenuis]
MTELSIPSQSQQSSSSSSSAARPSIALVMSDDRQLSKNERYLKVIVAVSAYWTCSIGLVFLNKYLLSSQELKLNAPLFVTWFHSSHTINFPRMTVDAKLSREVLPLSVVFVGMISFNNLCLKYVGVSFYYVGRSLTTVFNVVCTYIILGQNTSARAICCCVVIIAGFLVGVDQEDASGSLSVIGVLYGVLASLCVALNAIYTQSSLPVVGDSIWRLTMYNNLNAVVLFLPLMLLFGEIGEVMYFPLLFSPVFWTLMTLSGVMGFLMGYVTGWQIQATSALTHNISGTAKAAAQTVIAVIYYSEIKTLMWWASNAIVLFGSAAYTYVKKQEMDKKIVYMKSSDRRPLMSTKADDDTHEVL